MISSFFGRIKKAVPPISAARSGVSRLENLFASEGDLREEDRALINHRARSRVSRYLAVIIFEYAAQRAARLRNVINMAKETNALISVAERRNINCEFDPIFVETAALCFWSVMGKFWFDDEEDFWVEDESPDWDYLDQLRETLDLADSIISAAASPAFQKYLRAQVTSYMKTDANDSVAAVERFAGSVCTWTLHRATGNPSTRLTAIITAFCLKSVAEINRSELDALCRLAYARTL